MKKADIGLMNALHGFLTQYYKEYLQTALEEGEEVAPAILTAVNAFLKNNNVTVDMVESDDLMDLGLSLRSMVENETSKGDNY